jgi:hypothetical protein
VASENKANLPGQGRQIRDPKFEAQNKPKTPMPQMARARRVDTMSNKPNLPHFWAKNEGARKNKANPRGRRIDDGLAIDDLGQSNHGRRRRAAGRAAPADKPDA